MLVRLLLVEDVETDAELAVRRLRQDGVQCTYKRVETESAFAEALRAKDHDIILSDFSLPQFDGMSALALARRDSADVPFIFVSGTIGEERAIEALRCGAVDYVLKSNLKRLAPAVAMIDIEHLSIINDSYGRHAGDHLLRLIADRLRSRFNTESLAYFGAGSFAMLLENAGGQDHALRELQQHIVAIFEHPFRIEAHDVPVTVKSGLACRGSGSQDAEALVQNAEAGLHQAKAAGEQYQYHRLDLSSKRAARLALEHRLRGALENEQYLLYYQPKIDIATGRLEGVEALLRWDDPERGIVLPGEFLPILESTGMIVSVGEWALQHAAEQCRHWKAAGLQPVHVAVNCSPLQLRRAGFAEQVLDIIGGWTGGGWGLDLEITESLLIDPASAEVRKLRALRNAGVRVAIDDFGTGYSSLSRLSDLPVDTLKIDRSFIDGLPGDRASSRLVPTVISLARAAQLPGARRLHAVTGFSARPTDACRWVGSAARA